LRGGHALAEKGDRGQVGRGASPFMAHRAPFDDKHALPPLRITLKGEIKEPGVFRGLARGFINPPPHFVCPFFLPALWVCLPAPSPYGGRQAGKQKGCPEGIDEQGGPSPILRPPTIFFFPLRGKKRKSPPVSPFTGELLPPLRGGSRGAGG